MSDDLSPEPKKKPLISVEFQREVDLATGIGETRMFVKMYFDARDSGLLADIGDRRWRTLCALATYMDENGLCYPSQSRIAKDLSTTRESVNRRVQELLAYRFQGRPVITIRKARLSTANGGRWSNNVYQILPVTGLQIFGDDEAEKPGKTANSAYVTKTSHRPVCAKPNIGSHHTNQNQFLNKKVLNPLPNNDHKERRKGTPTISDRALRSKYGLETAQLAQVHYLVGKQGDVLGSIERDHGHFVKRAAEAVVGGAADLLDETLSRFKDIARKRSMTSQPAYFQAMWNEALEKREIRAGRDQREEDGRSTRHRGFEPLSDILRQPKGREKGDPPGEATLA